MFHRSLLAKQCLHVCDIIIVIAYSLRQYLSLLIKFVCKLCFRSDTSNYDILL